MVANMNRDNDISRTRRTALRMMAATVPVAVATNQTAPARAVEGRQAIQVTEGPLLATRYGVKADGETDDTTALQAALDAADRGLLILPAGTIRAQGLHFRDHQRVQGLGMAKSRIRGSGKPIVNVSGTFQKISALSIISNGGGHTVRQESTLSQSSWSDFQLLQYGTDFSLWDNAGHGYIDNRMSDFYSHHLQNATVPGWKLVGAGGNINNNVWREFRAQYSGNYHFWVESTSSNAQYSNRWDTATWEVCTGGKIRLISVRDYEISGSFDWDMKLGTPAAGQRHGILAEANRHGIQCTGTIRRPQRLAGQNATGIYDIVLPANGLGGGTSIEGPRGLSNGDPLTVDLRENSCVVLNPQFTTLDRRTGATILGNRTTAQINGRAFLTGDGIPNVAAERGSIYLRRDGAPSFWVKDTTGSSTSWTPVSPGYGSTTERPTQTVPRMTYYDTTLDRPIWRNAANTRWVDATGKAV